MVTFVSYRYFLFVETDYLKTSISLNTLKIDKQVVKISIYLVKRNYFVNQN